MKKMPFLRYLVCLSLCVCVGFFSVNDAHASGVLPNNAYVIPYDKNNTAFIQWGKSTIQLLAWNTEGEKVLEIAGNLSGDHYRSSNSALQNVRTLRFGKIGDGCNVMLYPGLYDYYFMGYVWSTEGYEAERFSFVPDTVSLVFNNCNDYDENNVAENTFYELEDLTISHMDSALDSIGFTWSGKMPDGYQTSFLEYVNFYDVDGGSLLNNLDYCLYVMAIPKVGIAGGSEVDLSGISSDLAELIQNGESTTQAVEELSKQIEELTKTDEAEDALGIGDKIEQVEDLLGPIDVASGAIDKITNLFSEENVSDATITFPSFSMTIEGVSYTVWPAYVFDFVILETHFPDLIFWIRRGLVIVFYIAVFNYVAQSFSRLITGSRKGE